MKYLSPIVGASVALMLGSLGAAALAPIEFDSREQLFEIPKGTWAHRRAGADIAILPSEIHLLVGLRDILVLRNLDDVPQTFGPTLIMPGQTFRLPFESASEYDFVCTAHASGEMKIIVEDAPASPASRLRWRAQALARAVSRIWTRGAAA
jgi:hypothetical protein